MKKIALSELIKEYPDLIYVINDLVDKFKKELLEKYRDEDAISIGEEIIKCRGLKFKDWTEGDDHTKDFISGVMYAIKELKIDELVNTREYVGDGFYQIDDDGAICNLSRKIRDHILRQYKFE